MSLCATATALVWGAETRERHPKIHKRYIAEAHGPKGIGMAPPYCVCEVPGTAFALLAVALWGGNGAVAPTIWAHGS